MPSTARTWPLGSKDFLLPSIWPLIAVTILITLVLKVMSVWQA